MAQLQRTRRTADPQRRPPTPRKRRQLRRLLRTIGIVVLILLIPVGWSYAHALTAPGNAPVSARTVEWIKEHGGRGAVLTVERLWYSWHKPPVGGTPSGGIPDAAGAVQPAQSSGDATTTTPPHLPTPADVTPLASHPLPREGRWKPVGRSVNGVPAVRVTYLRADDVHTSLLTGVMWMDTKLLQAQLVPGTDVPSGTPASDAEIPHARYPELAATFNSGFLLQDSHGGLYLNGHTSSPLQNRQASLVVYKDGSVDIGRWGSDVSMTPQVAAVRQNLSLLVAHARPVSGLSTDSFQKWGATLGNAVLVWRTGIGITANGALVYAAGPGLSVESLAAVLARAGAVRAMELDINTEWASAMYYTGHGAGRPTPHKLLASMYQGADRYLIPDQRDFFAMYLRRPAAS
ncbi:MAG: phosphodiester glycosidase family protein [Actinomycetota bacterium]